MDSQTRIVVPKESANDETCEILAIGAKHGAWIEKGNIIFEIENAKTVTEVTAPKSAFVELQCSEKQNVKVGQCIAILHESDNFLTDQKNQISKEVEQTTQYSDIARELLSRNNIKTSEFADHYYVLKSTVKDYLQADTLAKQHNLPDKNRNSTLRLDQGTSREKLSRHKMAELYNLQSSQNSTSSSVSINVHEAWDQVDTATHIEVSNMPYIDNKVFALILICISNLLKEFKELNAYYHDKHIHYHDVICIGMAIDMGKGLKVANLGDLSESTIGKVNNKVFDSAKDYVKSTLRGNSTQPTTFTVSDLTAYGITDFQPLIGKNQCAILGVCAIDGRPKSRKLILAFDHRVTEGRRASEFLQGLKLQVESSLNVME